MAVTITILGKIYPTVFPVNHQFSATHDQFGWQLKVQIENSALTATVEIPQFDLPTTSEALAFVREAVGVPINLLAFVNGTYFQVVFEEMIAPNGRAPMVVGNFSLAALNTAINIENINEMMGMVAKDSQRQRALSDLIELLASPRLANINCGRIFDGIKHLITPGSAGEGVKWANMQAALNVTERYLKTLTDHSADPRHGRPYTVPPNIDGIIFERCWTVMNRYFHYLQAGSKNLPVAQFPLLTSE